MKKFDLSNLVNADDDAIEKLPSFLSDSETKKRVLAMSEYKLNGLKNEKKDEINNEYSLSVVGEEKYRKPVWHKALCTAAAVAVIGGGLGTAALLYDKSRQPLEDVPAVESELENTIEEEQSENPAEEQAVDQTEEETMESVPTDTPVIDIVNDEVRFMAPAYAPCILDISTEQQNNLVAALGTAEWTPCDVNETLPDGEAYTMFVYNNGSPYSLTLYGDNTVKIESNTETTRWNVPAETAQAITETACPSADGGTLSGHLTWCNADTINISDIWKNTRVGAKQCDMTDKKDIFFKMNNTPDYFDRASGIVMYGCIGSEEYNTFTISEIYDFQVDLNMAVAYQHEETNKGTDYESFISADAMTDEMNGYISYYDGENQYSINLSDNLYYKYEDIKHRIDSPTVPYEELRCLGDESNDYDYWNTRKLLLDSICIDCIENYRQTVNYLGNFDNWDIVGTEEVNGRVCVHINGVCNIEYEQVKSFDWYIDEETGVTVRFKGYNSDGSTGKFTEVKNLKFNDEADPVKVPDFTGLSDDNY